MALRTLDGSEVVLGDSTMTHLLFVFTTTCPYCEKNWEHWANLSSLCNSTSLQAVGVSLHPLETTKEFVAQKRPDFVVCAGDTAFARAYKIQGVPTTILIRGDGTIEGVWIGPLHNKIGEIVQKLAPHLAAL